MNEIEEFEQKCIQAWGKSERDINQLLDLNFPNIRDILNSQFCNPSPALKIHIAEKIIKESTSGGSAIDSGDALLKSVANCTKDPVPLTRIAAASFIPSYTRGLPLLDVFHGNPSSITTRSANSNSSSKVIMVLSIAPLKGLLVLFAHGRLRSSLRGLFGTLKRTKSAQEIKDELRAGWDE